MGGAHTDPDTLEVAAGHAILEHLTDLTVLRGKTLVLNLIRVADINLSE